MTFPFDKMEETPSKRQREKTQAEEMEGSETKRYKSYNYILSLLEEEEEEPTQDLTSLITALQQELSSSDPLTNPTENDLDAPATTTTTNATSSSSSTLSSCSDEEEDRERVMRLLLEASDDELGIPNREEEVVVNSANSEEVLVFDAVDDELSGVGVFPDGLWEFEDVNVNYYYMLQSELFM